MRPHWSRECSALPLARRPEAESRPCRFHGFRGLGRKRRIWSGHDDGRPRRRRCSDAEELSGRVSAVGIVLARRPRPERLRKPRLRHRSDVTGTGPAASRPRIAPRIERTDSGELLLGYRPTWHIARVQSSPTTGAHAGEVLRTRKSLALLCMGLFSHFLFWPCRATRWPAMATGHPRTRPKRKRPGLSTRPLKTLNR